MARDTSKEGRGEHRSERDRSDRSTTTTGPGRAKDKESGGAARDRARSSSKEDSAVVQKRLRNEGESKVQSPSASSKMDVSTSPSKVSSSSSRPPSSTSLSTSPSRTPQNPVLESTTQEPVIPVINKKELYESVVEYENNLARDVEAQETVAAGQQICSELEQNYSEILSMIATPPEDMDDFEEKMEEGLLKISNLRQINRMMKLKLKSVKDDQLIVRSDVDSDHLLLQNLLYEATHLQNQVAAVQDYKGMDENIDLIPLNRFYEEAPDNIANPDATKNDVHLLRIARLEYEFIQRQKLTADCNSLEKEKEIASKNIDETQIKLDSIGPLLNNVLDATKPLQQFLDIDISAKREQNRVAQYLPAELNVLYVQSNAFREASGGKKSFQVHLRGNIEDAKELVVTDDIEEDSDSDKEQDPDVEISRRRLMRKKSSIYLSPEEWKKKIIQRHPLWIEWIVNSKENDHAVFIQFFYLVKLKIITVKVKSLEDAKKFPEGELASSDGLLDELYPEDKGTESPNPANRHIFYKVDVKGVEDFVSETGKPFIWAQKLAGLEFPSMSSSHDFDRNEEIEVRPKMDISATSIRNVLNAIRKRLSNQITLSNQLQLLENKNMQIPLEAKELFPSSMSTTFKSWESISFSQYSAYDFAKDHARADLVSDKWMFYKASLERGRAVILALVAICRDFPSTPPLFCVQIEKDGEHRNATNDPAIRDLEAEINVYSVPEFEQWDKLLISLQLMRLVQCVDIILETDFLLGESTGPSEFGREKLFLRAATGRNVRRPFKYVGTGGGYFSQRF